MPWRVESEDGGWAVITPSGRVSHHSSRHVADAQVRALHHAVDLGVTAEATHAWDEIISESMELAVTNARTQLVGTNPDPASLSWDVWLDASADTAALVAMMVETMTVGFFADFGVKVAPTDPDIRMAVASHVEAVRNYRFVIERWVSSQPLPLEVSDIGPLAPGRGRAQAVSEVAAAHNVAVMTVGRRVR